MCLLITIARASYSCGARTLFRFETRVLYALFLSVLTDIFETSSCELSLGPLEKVLCLFLWCLCNT